MLHAMLKCTLPLLALGDENFHISHQPIAIGTSWR